MHPINVLSKMALKTVQYGNIGTGSNNDVIDWKVAAHALAGLPREMSDWALFRYAGHEDKERAVVRALTMTVTLFIKISRFKVKPETLDGIVRASIVEHSVPVCVECDGSGLKKDTPDTHCPKCGGRGRKKLSTRKICRIIGISHQNYSDTHETITKEILRLISTWEQRIMKHIHEKMGE